MRIDKRNLIYLSLYSPFKTMHKLKGVFKSLKCCFRIGLGRWNYHPALWCSNPAFIHIISTDVMWKDKYDTPRYEVPPYIWIHIWKINFIWWWEYSDKLGETDDYWEQALWYLYYASCNKEKKGYDELNINKARDSWPWQDYETKKSTWNNKFLIK